MSFLYFIGYGLVFVLVPEFTNLVVINQIPNGLSGALVIYSVLLAFGYCVQCLIDRVFRGAVLSNSVCILFFGAFGLFLEWVFIGNSPSDNPDAIQWGMFVYWVGLYMVPRILVDARDAVKGLSARIKRIYLVYSALHLLIALTLPPHLLMFFVPLMWTVTYTCFGFFYLKYIRLCGA